MKTKRQGQSKLFVVLATLLTIVFFSFAGETDVKAAETYTQNYTPTRKSPLKKIEYINRGDNTFDINVTVDLSVYYPNDVLGIQEYDLTAWTNGTSGKEYVALQCGNTYTKSVAAKDYKFQMGSGRYAQLIGYIDASSYSYATAHIVEVYNYSTKNGEGSLFKRYVIKGSNNYQRSFKLTGLKPGTAKHYTVHLIRTDSSGTEYEYIDNQYWTLKSASFKTPSVSGVKFASKKAKLIINVPSTQASKGLSTMHVYKGNKKIKTIKSNGKTRITFVYSGSKASTSSYKVKAVCAKNTKITKTSKAKKPVASKYKRQGWINPNINAITPYATATFVPWEMSYYNGKVTVTGYVVNNRIFKLKTYKVKVGVGVDNKIYASTTKTYKNVKDSTIKKVKFSFKSKKALDFVNNSPTWSVRTLKSVW